MPSSYISAIITGSRKGVSQSTVLHVLRLVHTGYIDQAGPSLASRWIIPDKRFSRPVTVSDVAYRTSVSAKLAKQRSIQQVRHFASAAHASVPEEEGDHDESVTRDTGQSSARLNKPPRPDEIPPLPSFIADLTSRPLITPIPDITTAPTWAALPASIASILALTPTRTSARTFIDEYHSLRLTAQSLSSLTSLRSVFPLFHASNAVSDHVWLTRRMIEVLDLYLERSREVESGVPELVYAIGAYGISSSVERGVWEWDEERRGVVRRFLEHSRAIGSNMIKEADIYAIRGLGFAKLGEMEDAKLEMGRMMNRIHVFTTPEEKNDDNFGSKAVETSLLSYMKDYRMSTLRAGRLVDFLDLLGSYFRAETENRYRRLILMRVTIPGDTHDTYRRFWWETLEMIPDVERQIHERLLAFPTTVDENMLAEKSEALTRLVTSALLLFAVLMGSQQQGSAERALWLLSSTLALSNGVRVKHRLDEIKDLINYLASQSRSGDVLKVVDTLKDRVLGSKKGYHPVVFAALQACRALGMAHEVKWLDDRYSNSHISSPSPSSEQSPKPEHVVRAPRDRSYDTAKSLAWAGDVEGTEANLQALSGSNLPTDIQALDILLQAHVCNNDSVRAEALLSNILAVGPSVKSMVRLMRLYGNRKDVVSTVGMFDRILEAGHQPDATVFRILVRLFYRVGDLASVDRVVDSMRELGVEQSAGFVVALLEGDVKMEDWDRATKRWKGLSKEMKMENGVVSAVLKAFVALGSPTRLTQLLFDRISRPTAYHWAHLIQSYCNAGEIDKAVALHEAMEKRSFESKANPRQDIYTYSILLFAHLRMQQSVRAKETYEALLAKKLIPTSITYATIINAFTSGRSTDSIKQAHDFAMSLHRQFQAGGLPEVGLKREQIPSQIFSPLLGAAVDSGRMETAQGYFDLAASATEPGIPLWTSLMQGHRKAGNKKRVLQIWDTILNLAKKKIERRTYTSLAGSTEGPVTQTKSNLLCMPLSVILDMYGDELDHAGVKRVWEETREAGFGFDARNYNDYAMNLARTGDVEGAFHLVDKVIIPRFDEVRSRQNMSLRPESGLRGVKTTSEEKDDMEETRKLLRHLVEEGYVGEGVEGEASEVARAGNPDQLRGPDVRPLLGIDGGDEREGLNVRDHTIGQTRKNTAAREYMDARVERKQDRQNEKNGRRQMERPVSYPSDLTLVDQPNLVASNPSDDDFQTNDPRPIRQNVPESSRLSSQLSDEIVQQALVDPTIIFQRWRPSDQLWRPFRHTLTVLATSYTQILQAQEILIDRHTAETNGKELGLRPRAKSAWVGILSRDEETENEDQEFWERETTALSPDRKRTIPLRTFNTVVRDHATSEPVRSTPAAFLAKLNTKYTRLISLVLLHRRKNRKTATRSRERKSLISRSDFWVRTSGGKTQGKKRREMKKDDEKFGVDGGGGMYVQQVMIERAEEEKEKEQAKAKAKEERVQARKRVESGTEPLGNATQALLAAEKRLKEQAKREASVKV